MMMRRVGPPATIPIGFAARADGEGIAYAAVRGADGGPETFVRVRFRSVPLPALRGRDVAYAALAAVARDLHERGIRRATFELDDPALPVDLAERRALPTALAVPYVRLRCTLNRFDEARVVHVPDGSVRDLTARARADVCFGRAA
jgi:hypothetical protein